MNIELQYSESAPSSEFSTQFLQGMLDRMAMSYHKYGAVADGYPSRMDAIESLKLRLDKYARTGNTEFLMDAANFAMIEFMRPRHPEAHFAPSDSSQSPGRARIGEINPDQERNIEVFDPPPANWRD